MKEVKYDDTGLVTSYLLFTLILPITLYQCYKLAIKYKFRRCKCRNCLSVTRTTNLSQLVVVSLLVAGCAYLTNNIVTIKVQMNTHKFDPWKIIGVPKNTSSEVVIRKAYMKKMRKLKRKSSQKIINEIEYNDNTVLNNSSKAKDGNKPSNENEIIDLNNAYSILSNFEEYDKWESKLMEEKSVIGVPEIVNKFQNYSIAVYLAVLAGICGFCGWKYWLFITRSNFGVSFKSTKRFYEKMDCFIEDTNVLIVELLIFISRNEEFTKHKWASSLAQKQKKSVKSVLMANREEYYCRIWSYLARDGLYCSKDNEYIKKSLLETVNAYVKIAGLCQKMKLFEGLLLLRQMVVQAVCLPELFIEELPVSTSVAMQLRNGGRKGIEGIGCEIEKVLSGRDLAEAKSVLSKIPRVKISDARAFVLDTTMDSEEHILEQPGEIVRREGANTFLVELNAMAKLRFNFSIEGGEEIVHSPFGSGKELRNSWTVYLKTGNTLISPIIEFDGHQKEREIEFSLNGLCRSTELQIMAVSNKYMGINCETCLYIKLVK